MAASTGKIAFSAWLKQEAAERLFACAGRDLETERTAAEGEGFSGSALEGGAGPLQGAEDLFHSRRGPDSPYRYF